MSKKLPRAVKCRAIINSGPKLLLVRQAGEKWWCLPGGKVRAGETLAECLERELVEELGVKPRIGKMFYIRELIDHVGHTIEFYFHVKNGKDFKKAETKDASHRFELDEFRIVNLEEEKDLVIYPEILRKLFPELVKANFDIPTTHLGKI